MPIKSKTSADRLYSIAESQQGWFTAVQAVSAGFSDYLHPYHVRRGHWERAYRGIYRLSKYPRSMDSHYVAWSLWSRNRQGAPQGVYSHETALSMHELSDANPAKIHMTVPPSFRRHSQVPKILVLHKGIIPAGDIEEREGYRVTRPARTIRDLLHADSTSHDIVSQAITEGFAKGVILRKELETLANEFPDEKHLFRDLLPKTRK